MSSLRDQIIRLAYDNSELRPHLLPLIKNGARPIPLDRSFLRRLVKDLLSEAKRTLRGYDKYDAIGVHKELARITTSIKNVMGSKFRIHVVLRSDRRPLNASQLFTGGLGTHRGTGDTVIIISCSHDLSVSNLLDHAQAELQEVLAHELTHARDKPADGDVQRYEDDEGNLDLKKYYNDPQEVRAFMRQIVEEAWPRYRKFRGILDDRKALELARKTSTWHEIKGHLTRRNRKLILKGIVRGLQDLAEQEG